MSCNLGDDEVDASVFTDDLKHTSSHHSDDDEFSHSYHAIAHGREPSENVVTAVDDADDATENGTQCQYCHHIHASNSRDEYYYIR